MSKSKSVALHGILVLGSLLIGFGLLEAAAQTFVATVSKQGKLFAPDARLGWVPLANLDKERLNANGDPWQITTDAQRIRGASGWPDDARARLLVLGDSFAFGEGVDLEDRFDTLLQELIPDLAVVNLGVMGYGPDQELIRARPWMDDLRAGDILLLLTYGGNDFHDLARTRHGGRAKPWIEDRGDRLVEHPPAIGLVDLLRDRSYIFTKLARDMAVSASMSDETEQRLAGTGQLYRKLVLEEVAPLLARGVRVVIAHHGDAVRELPFDVAEVFAGICPQVSGCLALDPALAAEPRERMFLEDGHWAAGGHRVAAARIGSYLRQLPVPVARADDANHPTDL